MELPRFECFFPFLPPSPSSEKLRKLLTLINELKETALAESFCANSFTADF